MFSFDTQLVNALWMSLQYITSAWIQLHDILEKQVSKNGKNKDAIGWVQRTGMSTEGHRGAGVGARSMV